MSVKLTHQEEIDLLNRKLVGLASLLEKQSIFVRQLKRRVDGVLDSTSEEKKDTLNWLSSKIKEFETLEAEYDVMKAHFEEIHPKFYNKLNEHCPNLNHKDMRLAAFIKMRFTNQEIAFLLNISHNGIKKAIQRLRKKLKMSERESLREFIINV